MTAKTLRWLLVAAALLALGARAQSFTYLERDFRQAGPKAAAKVLVLPLDVNVYELTAGGVTEKVPDWSRQAREHITAALRQLRPTARFEIVQLPENLTEAERATLDEHVTLFDLVGFAVTATRSATPWRERAEAGLADYSLGPGLAYLADRTGADQALVLIAHDFVSSAERKAMFAVGLLFGVGIPLGRTFAAAGLIDLRTGKILWESYDLSATPDLRVAADAERVVRDLFASFPNVTTK